MSQDESVIRDDDLHRLAEEIVTVPGVVAVVLGGSRARGDHHPDSDHDLGLYYRPPLDVEGLRTLARRWSTARPGEETTPTLTEPGGWGPWVDGGGWLQIDDGPVDWIYRDVDRVRRSIEQAVRGEFDFHFQVGHPLGVSDAGYAGEVALGVVLADPSGEVTGLQRRVATYPPALSRAIVARLDEARFLCGALGKPVRRGDTTYVAGCLFRVVSLCALAIHARAGRWVVNEKGLIDAAARLEPAPPDFASRAHGLLGGLGTEPDRLSAAVRQAEELVAEVGRRCRPE